MVRCRVLPREPSRRERLLCTGVPQGVVLYWVNFVPTQLTKDLRRMIGWLSFVSGGGVCPSVPGCSLGVDIPARPSIPGSPANGVVRARLAYDLGLLCLPQE